MPSTSGWPSPSEERRKRRDRHPVQIDARQFAGGVAIRDARRVVYDVGHAAIAADDHHHVARDIDEIADLQRAEHGESRRMIVGRGEGDAIQRRAHRLIACIARQLYAEAAVHLRDEAAAVARVVRVTPAVAFAEKLETLAQQIGAVERQIVAAYVRRLRQQCWSELQ